jgi:hypothetical protein
VIDAFVCGAVVTSWIDARKIVHGELGAIRMQDKAVLRHAG